ncbi:MAG: hypothetical protein FWD14_05775 [Treponema sp.]|nr:hypothetical protein [Treponema sp.]
MVRAGAFSFLFIFVIFALSAQGLEWGSHPYVIRGEVFVDIEPIYAGFIDEEYPLDFPTASRRALEEAALFFSAMIYGWSFNYEVGERARQIDEILELESLGSVQFGDPAMRVTDSEIRDMRLRIWADYHLNDNQQRRMNIWRTGMIRNAQAVGYGPSHLDEYPGWLALKKTALDDAARSALRFMLRGSERNRPKEVTGFISLASFPRYYIDGGRWAVSARFRVQITEIIPFSAY